MRDAAAVSRFQSIVDADAVDGRGLRIVVALADHWGVERDGLGQTVWAQLHAERSENSADSNCLA
jgi:hypothetical protein